MNHADQDLLFRVGRDAVVVGTPSIDPERPIPGVLVVLLRCEGVVGQAGWGKRCRWQCVAVEGICGDQALEVLVGEMRPFFGRFDLGEELIAA